IFSCLVTYSPVACFLGDFTVAEYLKLIMLLVVLCPLLWLSSGSFSGNVTATSADPQQGAKPIDDQYIGTETCKACHEDQFNNFLHTSHAKLGDLGSWKGKVTGCEACHGPGKAHAEEGDPKKIISFKNKGSKLISETCLTCHAGREEHNNFRRGEHWRNDIGCTDCHSPHSEPSGRQLAASNVFVSPANTQN